jgi:hypothetical protein
MIMVSKSKIAAESQQNSSNHDRLAEQSGKAMRQPSPAALAAVAMPPPSGATLAAHGALLQDRIGSSQHARDTVLQLQRHYGNRYVQRALAKLPVPLQAKLAVGSVNDPAEREADRIADLFSRATGMTPPPQPHAQPAPSTDTVNRDADNADYGAEGGELTADLNAAITGARSGGHPLKPTVRGTMEQFFGQDLGQVRVHADGAADRISRAINAVAFTSGRDIFFRRGAYRPDHLVGKHLLAHELTHVVQQSGGSQVQRQLQPGPIEAAPAPLVQVQAQPGTLIRRSPYALLSPTQQKQVDAKAESIYYDQASVFEQNLGKVAEKSSQAQEAVKTMSKRVKQLVDAWGARLGGSLDALYVQTFGGMSVQDTGSILPIAEDIKAVLDSGSLRERLTILYSAIRNDTLQTLLQWAYQDAMEKGKDIAFDWIDKTTGSTQRQLWSKGFSKEAGLKKFLKKNTAVTADMAARIDPMLPVNMRGRLFERGAEVTKTEHSGEKQFINEVKVLGTLGAHQTIEAADLSERELRMQLAFASGTVPMTKAEAETYARMAGMEAKAWLMQEYQRWVKGWYDAEANRLRGDLSQVDYVNWLDSMAQPASETPTLWIPGESWYRAQVDSALSTKASKIKATLRAGISGTTDMYLHAAQYLGMHKQPDLQKVRLAMLAWMLPARDHSFYEIMLSATQDPYKLTDFDPDQPLYLAYEKEIKPLDKAKNKRAIPAQKPGPHVPAGKFPGYYLSPPAYPHKRGESTFKDILAQHWLPNSGLAVRSDAELNPLVAKGVPRGLMENLQNADFQALQQLDQAVAAAGFNGVDLDANPAVLQNFIDYSVDFLHLTHAVGANNAFMVLTALVLHQGPARLPVGYEPYAMGVSILVPQAKGTRMTPAEIAAFDPDTHPALQRPDSPGEATKDLMFYNYYLNRQRFIEMVVNYHPDRFRDNPTQMDAWFENYQRKLEQAFPGADLSHLRGLNQARLHGIPGAEETFNEEYEKVFGLHELTDQERIAITNYTITQGADAMNAAARGDWASLAAVGDAMGLLSTALEKLPSYSGGPVYRGDGDRGFQGGRVIHYQEYISTAKTVKSSFINKPQLKQLWGLTHAIVIENHKSGKDISALSGYTAADFENMEGEILFPPGTRFVVKRIEDWRHLTADPAEWDLQQDLLRAINTGNVPEQQRIQAQLDQNRVRNQSLNMIWVYLDEV